MNRNTCTVPDFQESFLLAMEEWREPSTMNSSTLSVANVTVHQSAPVTGSQRRATHMPMPHGQAFKPNTSKFCHQAPAPTRRWLARIQQWLRESEEGSRLDNGRNNSNNNYYYLARDGGDSVTL